MDFEPTGNTGKTPGELFTREWKHKLINFQFWQAMNRGNKTWHTGTWSKKLKTLADGKVKLGIGNITVCARAKYILSRRNNFSGPVGPPVKGMAFFPFKKDLNHHIQEALATLSTGSAMSFYGNPFVKDWLSGLEARHRPVYRQKLCRLIRCSIDTTGIEVCVVSVLLQCIFTNTLILNSFFQINRLVTESYIKYHNSFICSTSDFWWEPVRNTNYAGSAGNLMYNHFRFNNGL